MESTADQAKKILPVRMAALSKLLQKLISAKHLSTLCHLLLEDTGVTLYNVKQVKGAKLALRKDTSNFNSRTWLLSWFRTNISIL